MWKHKCKPDLGQSPLETSDVEGPRWWRERLTAMENDVRKVCTDRPDVLLSVIGDRQTFKMVSGIFKLDDNECDQLCIKDLERERAERLEAERLAFEARCREEMKSMHSKQSRSMDLRAMMGSTLDDEDDEDEEEEEEDISSESTEVEEVVEYVDSISTEDGEPTSLSNEPGSKQERVSDTYDGYTNPYLNFLRRPKDAAPTWRPRAPPIPTGLYAADPNMTLLEKSHAITNKIATDFCSWMRNLGSATPPDIDEKTLIELFALDFDKPASWALVNRRQEMTALTPAMAKAWDFPEMDFRCFMRHQIRSDILAESRPPKTSGFGSELDPDARIVPPRNNTQAQWKGYKPPADLASFTTAFSDLSHLESYQGYIKYLKRNPELPRPPCLKRWGLFGSPDALVVMSRTSLEMEQAAADRSLVDTTLGDRMDTESLQTVDQSMTSVQGL